MADTPDTLGQTNPINPAQITDLREIGVSGLRRWSGFVLDDFLPQLLQWKGIDIYREMAYNDPDIGAILFGIRMMCRRVAWRVEPATQQPYDVDSAKWLDTCFNDMSRTWMDTVDEILFNMLPFGHAPMEVVYKRRGGKSSNPSYKSKYSDGRIGWLKFEIRHPDTIWRWAFDDHGGILGLWQMAPPRYIQTFIPIEKLALFRASVNKNNPEGFSVLRNAYRPWYLKKNLENIEAIGAERDLAGLPVAKVPPEILSSGASPAQKQMAQMIKNIVTNIKRDEQEGVLWPLAYDANGNELFKLELMSSAGSRQFDTDKIINRYRQSIMMTVFADFLLLGHNSSGNRSIVETRSDLFCTAVGAFMDIICDVMNRHMIPKLFELNPDLEISDYPQVKHGDLMASDLDALSNYFLRLSQTGMPMWPNTELQKYLMDAAHAPKPVDPMKVADELEVQPRTNSKPSEQIEIPADPMQTIDAGYPYPTYDIPTPGEPAVRSGEASTPFPPYPVPKL